MVQMSLLEAENSMSLEELLRLRAARHAPGHARIACQATRARFASWSAVGLTPAQTRRVSAYFDAVVRRRVISQRDEESIRARRDLVRMSIEVDLRAAGWSAARAMGEAMRIIGASSEGSAA